MHIVDTVQHSANGHDYEIISLWTGTEWRVIIRDEEFRQVGPLFSMTLEAGQDYERTRQQPAIDALVNVAKQELDAGRVKSGASTGTA